MDRVYPPFRELPASDVMSVVDETKGAGTLRLRVATAGHRAATTSPRRSASRFGAKGDTRERLAEAGIVVSPGDAPTIASVRPGSEAARQKLRPGDKIEAVSVPAERPSPFLFAIPALIALSASPSCSGAGALSPELERNADRPAAFRWREPAHPCRTSSNVTTMEPRMNWDRVEGNWKQLTGKVKEKWGKLTDDDLAQINGNREQLEGKLQARYGYAKDQVKKDVDDWLGRM